MIAYDILMLIIVAGYTIFGAYKGMAWQIATLCSLVVSYFAALRFSDSLAPLLSQQAPWNRFLAMLVIFLVSSLVIWILFRFVSKFIEQVKLKDFDRQVGALFGLFKGVLACVAVTFFAVTLSEAARGNVLKSRSGHYIGVLLAKADPIMPEQLHDVLGPYVHELQDKLNQPSSHGHDRGGTGNGDETENTASEGPFSDTLTQADWQKLKRIVRDVEGAGVDAEDLDWVRQNLEKLDQLARSASGGENGPTDGQPTLWDRARNLIEGSNGFQELLNELRFGGEEESNSARSPSTRRPR